MENTMKVVQEVKEVRPLVYNESLLGLRFFADKGVYDAERGVLRESGVYNIDIPNKLHLKPKEDLLLSDEEIESGVLAEDLSNNRDGLKTLVKLVLESKTWGKVLTKVKQPHELTLKDFMDDDGWVATRVNRTDEYKNQHNLTLPDGTNWKGGWIGSARSPEKAKQTFHMEQVRWALFRGECVPPKVLEDYPKLKEVDEVLQGVESDINSKKVAGADVFSIDVDGKTREFKLSDFPYDSRIDSRGFVGKQKLVPSSLVEKGSMNEFFSPTELVLISIVRKIRKLKKKQENQSSKL